MLELMMKEKFSRVRHLWLGLLLLPFCANAQLNINQILGGEQNNTTVQQDSLYATMEVPAEKLANKKFTLTRRWYQNLVTHFNFVYNARQNLRIALETATRQHQDDYTRLLDFYPYTFAEFSQTGNLLDSVIFRASVGIQVHDPRGKWIDDLYLLLGKAFYYEQKFIEAERAFQFINLHEAPAVKGEYTPVIGSLAEGSTQISIVSPEKKGFFHHHPSRNEALLWLVKTFLAEQQTARARSLLDQLLHDPRFPPRLEGKLYETAAFFYYQLQQYDQVIPYLRKAVALQTDKMLQSRWAYLLGQMEMQQKDTLQAITAFHDALRLSHEPLLQFYAAYQIALLQQVSAGSGAQPDAPLVEMARKNKYERYRDIIYHGLAQLALARSDTAKAIADLLSSLHAQSSKSRARGNSALLLASLWMEQRQFDRAASYVDTALQVLPDDDPRRDSLNEQLTAMRALAHQMGIVARQDSLQQLAALPPDIRLQKVHAIWKDMLARQRQAQRAEQRMASEVRPQSSMPGMQNPATQANAQSASGQWYFNNPDLKARGYVVFKQIWGNRPLVDNWRRASAIQGFTPSATATLTAEPAQPTALSGTDSTLSMGERTLLAHIPLSPEQLKTSNDSIFHALLEAARILAFQLQRPDLAKDQLNALLQRNPQPDNYPEIGYLLYLIYRQLHDTSQAMYYREVLIKNYPETEFARALQPASAPHTFRLSTLYDSAYACYVQERYAEALQWIQQAQAHHPVDSLQMQLTLLQAMAFMKIGSEDSARQLLERLALQYPGLPAGAEAKRILDVWQHKQELIAHLESLSAPGPTQQDNMHPQPIASQPPSRANPIPVRPKTVDSSTTAPPAMQPPPARPVSTTPYALNEKDPHFVMLLFQHPDARLLEEATQRFTTYLHASKSDSGILVGPYALTPTQTMLVFRIFPDENHALEFLDQIRAAAPALLKGLPTNDYAFYIISRSNFIILNQTKDLTGYVQFFNDNYITQ